jgi:crotonobetainyl-CoA:carnitine CoA-transferase CaiB-like acyl-CoA transferase
MSAQILDGIRVLELAQGMAAPVAAMLLAESGADVIKIEPPGGDPTRAKSGFAVWNRSKRSVVLDLTSEGGRAELGRLLESADVLIHDLGPKAAVASGLDDATLSARHPQLIICSVPAFPVPHPDADRVARDTLVLARAGILDEQQAVERAGPTFLRIPLCSIGAWHLAAAGVVARLIARERDGIGGPAHTSLLQGALVPLTMHWARAERPTQSFARGMPKDAGDSLFQCGDGLWIHLMANPDGSPLMQEVFAEMGEEGVRQANARHKPGQMGASHPNYGANVEALTKRPRQEWLESLWASDVPVQPCLALGELYFDEQANVNGYVVEVEDPEWGTTRQPGHPYATVPSSRVKGPAPTLGQHTEEVRSEEGSAGFEVRGTCTGKPPLDGLKVLDFGNFLAGPLAAMLMADLGADVIKLEATTGDMMRHSVERVFSGCQRGKRGIALNLKHPDTRPVVEKLVQWADVVHHNLRYPAARRLRIDYESLKELNPKLIYCHTSSYGPKGPRADWPGFDQLFQASSGWEYEGAGEGNRPMWHRFGMMDHQNALASLTATLLAIYHRMRTGPSCAPTRHSRPTRSSTQRRRGSPPFTASSSAATSAGSPSSPNPSESGRACSVRRASIHPASSKPLWVRSRRSPCSGSSLGRVCPPSRSRSISRTPSSPPGVRRTPTSSRATPTRPGETWSRSAPFGTWRTCRLAWTVPRPRWASTAGRSARRSASIRRSMRR